VSVQLLDPETLPTSELYAQVAVATGTRTVFLAGQVARTADGEPVGPGDLAAQTEQAYLNVAAALEAAGGTFDDVAKVTLYVVDWGPDKMAALGEGVFRAAARLGVGVRKPVTLLSVTALGEPDLLVEVEAVAVLD
jgi:enamine deaminase RidA (YjgF/YER057c/UK114 family)